MNKYWSNEDDKKVSYTVQRPVRNPRVNGGVRQAGNAQKPQAGEDAFSYPQRLNQRSSETEKGTQASAVPQYGHDRSSFISDEANHRQKTGNQFAPPPQFGTQQPPPPPQQIQPDYSGYQVHTEPPEDDKHKRGNFWLKFLVVILSLALIAGGAYIFRHEIITWIGNTFGEEVVWKIMPTPEPTAVVTNEPAYIDAVEMEIKPQSAKEIDAVTGGLALESHTVTENNVILQEKRQNGLYDYYVFDYETGRLLGYYEALPEMLPCGKNSFYIPQTPFLITSGGFPLADLEALSRSAGSEVTIAPMINGWAIVTDAQGAKYNFVGEDGKMISNLWFVKVFPFTGAATLAYMDTGNAAATEQRYALYLLQKDGETKRLRYAADTDEIMASVCGLAFTQDGQIITQDEALTPIGQTDEVTAYVNCGMLVVRDEETGQYGLFVDGVQQYPYAFDSIEPVASDLVWDTMQTGYITLSSISGHNYPLPSAYRFVLSKDGTEQVISIAAVSVYPIILD